MLEKKATTSMPIHELFARRWSPRAYDPKKTVTREQLAALLEYTPMAMIAVGYQAEPDTIEFADIKEKELAPRTRKPLPQRFFEGGWGKGISVG